MELSQTKNIFVIVSRLSSFPDNILVLDVREPAGMMETVSKFFGSSGAATSSHDENYHHHHHDFAASFEYQKFYSSSMPKEGCQLILNKFKGSKPLADSQLWIVQSNGEIRSYANPNLSVDLKGGKGSQLVLWSMNSSDSQMFYFDGEHIFSKVERYSKCLDVKERKREVGNDVISYKYNDGANQKWYLVPIYHRSDILFDPFHNPLTSCQKILGIEPTVLLPPTPTALARQPSSASSLSASMSSVSISAASSILQPSVPQLPGTSTASRPSSVSLPAAVTGLAKRPQNQALFNHHHAVLEQSRQAPSMAHNFNPFSEDCAKFEELNSKSEIASLYHKLKALCPTDAILHFCPTCGKANE